MLPQLSADVFLCDGGLETTLVFLDGLDLPEFAAFPLLDDETGRAVLHRYWQPYLDLAERVGRGIVLDTPTWRANPVWGAVLGYDADRLAAVNGGSVEFMRAVAAERPGLEAVVNGVIGPRGDGYVVDTAMSAPESAQYHSAQARAFADAGADMMSAVTMNHAAEATGVVMAGVAVGLPTVISFTVETDGRLPSGQALGEAIEEVDAATDSMAAYFMVNCAHPTHFDGVIGGDGAWRSRIKGVRANSSTRSHAELDDADELDRGDPADLAARYVALRDVLPDLRVVGGCCGTDLDHISAIADALT